VDPDKEQILLENVFAEVLEKFAFMFNEPTPPPELPIPDSPAFCARIEFDGPRRGRLEVAAPADMCYLLAANILGIESTAVNADGAKDALKEMLNVACGEFVEQLAGPQAVFNLSIPDLAELDEDGWRRFAARPGAHGMLVDNMPVILLFEDHG
jgi:hypothetical protein